MRVTVAVFLLAIQSISAFVPGTQFVTGTSGSTALFMSDEVKGGTVKWFNTQKGFGFIVPDDGTPDVFVHQTNINTEGFRSLADGEKVEFQTETDSSGRSKAINVTGPDGTEVQGAPFREAY
mmetsp:Transcript_18045/g.22428  ORF Transcript_18045/g.22428 Transcript_18045/m.22428 type:complete len:122 (+) Transcript_18045:160-525(+)|eukprot:CAMPEP_0172520816 /NCGR_PEP_ID=MMETSP1066-20121228/292218_1 /TAXON_ID=671091 /ORGANISM="Coscinodiscus wailesii, Strain CCMP2513" /LENGTH=121 /DNA_ID=CAMNT_0013303629 /DNA_START=514 /DNA_END=879 /DNA_ORIENTATION=-